MIHASLAGQGLRRLCPLWSKKFKNKCKNIWLIHQPILSLHHEFKKTN